MNNLLPSEITPCAANGNKMYSIGKMLVTFTQYSEDMHIYPNKLCKAAKALGILHEHYPNPIPLVNNFYGDRAPPRSERKSHSHYKRVTQPE